MDSHRGSTWTALDEKDGNTRSNKLTVWAMINAGGRQWRDVEGRQWQTIIDATRR